MKNLSIVLLLLVSTSAFAFGGGGGGRTRRFYERHGGVDAIGVHIHDGGKQADVIICEDDEELWNNQCVFKCATGEERQLDGTCKESCPAERQCGETCCGEGHTCQDGQCCDANNNCCNAAEATGYGTEDGKCCTAGTKPFFSWWDSEHDYDTFCCAPDKTINRINGHNVNYKECCDDNYVPYIGYTEDDSYFEQYCCSKQSSLTSFGHITACCQPSKTAYCEGKKGDGTCYSASCYNADTEQLYPCWYNYDDEDTNYCACTKDKTLTQFNKVSACCPSDQTPYCAQKDTNGNCQHTSCCSGTVHEGLGSNGADLCCPTGRTPYCSNRNSQGVCTSWGCCSGTVLTNTKRSDLCTSCSACCYLQDSNGDCVSAKCRICSDGKRPYCSIRDNDGTCQVYDCCEKDAYLYCYYKQNGICLDQVCCPNGGHVTRGIGYNTADMCFINEVNCETNADCTALNTETSTYYCDITADSCYTLSSGTCREVNSIGLEIKNITGLGDVIMGTQEMTWWSADNWCKAQELRLIETVEIGCYKNGNTLIELPEVTTTSCCSYGNDCSYSSSWFQDTTFSEVIRNLRAGYGTLRVWGQPHASIISFANGQVANSICGNNTHLALCK